MSELRRQKQAERASQGTSPKKPRIDAAIIVLGIATGLAAAYHLTKVEWAIPFGVICLLCIVYLIGEIPGVRKLVLPRRLAVQLACLILIAAVSYPTVTAEYSRQHAALNSGLLEP